MKRLILIATALLTVVGIASAQSKAVIVEHSFANPEKIVINSAIEVTLVKASGFTGKCQVEASVPEDIKDSFYCTLFGKKLEMGVKGVMNNFKGKVKVTISVPSFEEIKLTGASTLKSRDQWSCRNVEIEASGASRISALSIDAKSISIEASGASTISEISVQCKELELEVSGASKIVVSGEADYLEAEASGASRIDAAECVCKKGDVDASGASKVDVNITGVIHPKYSGASTIINRAK